MKDFNYNRVKEVRGTKFYLLDGRCHRTDGPAIEYANGTIEYHTHGKLHRKDGPARIYFDGRVSYALCGNLLPKEEWFKRLTKEEQKFFMFNEGFK